VSWAPGFPCALFAFEGIADCITSGATRREIAMSYPTAGRIYRKQLTRIGVPTFPCPVPLFATLRRFSQRAPPDPRKSGGGNFDGTWVAIAAGTPCGSSTERFVISGGSLSGELSSGSVSPERLHADRRIRARLELDQHRPFLRPQRRWFLRAIGRLHRTLDGF
jgi:hypothetical protein